MNSATTHRAYWLSWKDGDVQLGNGSVAYENAFYSEKMTHFDMNQFVTLGFGSKKNAETSWQVCLGEYMPTT